jgi:hypothetical protein
MTRQLQIGSVLLLAWLSVGCAQKVQKPANPVQHVVLLWFTARTDSWIQQVEAETLKLRAIPQVLSLETGQAIKSNREIVDDSFDLGITVTFRSVEDMKKYLVAPRHTKFVDTWLTGRLDKMQVYDF